MKSFSILLGLLLLPSFAAVADEHPNFTGKWQLDMQKSEFGEFPKPDSMTNVYDHKDPNLKVTQTIKGENVPGGEVSSERLYTTDGKENVNHLGPQDVKSTSHWDGSKLITEIHLDTPNGKIDIKDSSELGDSGKQLLITRNFKGPQGETSQKLVFTKQP